MDRTLLGILTAIGAALLLVGLTFSRSVDAPADFRFNNQTEPKTLDPQRMTGQPEMRIAAAIFEGLTRREVRTMKPIPGVAESWEISPDGQRYTFHLRKNARWTDGHAVTASDFIYAWKRLLDPTFASEYAYIIFPIRYAEALNTFDGHADALDTTIPKALAEFAAAHADGAEARDWQRFLSKNQVTDPFRHQEDPALRALLARNTGRVTKEELAGMRGAAQRASSHLRKEAAEARAHFGIDGGAIAVDDHTLVVELRAPTPYFLELTTYYPLFPAPRWIAGDPKHADDWFLPEHIVSNGAYVLKRWLVHDHIRLERSETYWGRDEVRLRSIDAFSAENEVTVMNLYLTHAIDWDPEMYARELGHELRQRPDFHLTPGMSIYFYKLNTTHPPLDDRRVRKAINLSIDRKAIVEKVLGLGQIAATTFVPPGIPGYEPPESDLGFDPPRARALLAEAGLTGGKGLPEIGILYNTNQMHKTIAEFVADQLRQNLGIRANAYNQEWQSYLATVRSLDYDVTRSGWIGDYTDPNTFLDIFVTNGGNNQTGFSSERYDALLRGAADVSSVIENPDALLAGIQEESASRTLVEQARHATSPAEGLSAQARLRMRILREAERLLVNDELPIIPLYFYVNANFVSPQVKNLYTTLTFDDGTTRSNVQDDHPLRDIWVDRTVSWPR